MQRTELKLLRVRHGLTQDKMAIKLGYGRNQYGRIENGEQGVTLNFLTALCEAFGMSLEEAKELTKRDKERQTENDCETCGE